MVKIKKWEKIGLLMLSFLLTLVILEIGLRIVGHMLLSTQRATNKITSKNIYDMKQNNTYVILTVGESTTAHMYGGIDTWPAQLEDILNRRSEKTKFKVFNEGRGGTNTAFILSRLEKHLEKYQPDIVISMMGSNDNELWVMYDNSFTKKKILWFQDLRVYKLSKYVKTAWLERTKKEIPIFYNNSEPWDNQLVKSIDVENEIYDSIVTGTQRFSKGDVKGAEKMFYKAIELNESNFIPYAILGDFYFYLSRYEDAEHMYLKAIGMQPTNKRLHLKLGHNYFEQHKYVEAEKYLKIGLELNLYDQRTLAALGRSYLRQNKMDEAEYFFNNLMQSSVPDYIYRVYTHDLIELNLTDNKIEEFYQKFDPTFVFKPNLNKSEITKYHYQRLYAVLNEKGIKYIAMQYPTMKVDELKNMFRGNENIIFVSNEENFKKVLQYGRYEEYFIDTFGGNWGHATARGNYIIAENVANVILS